MSAQPQCLLASLFIQFKLLTAFSATTSCLSYPPSGAENPRQTQERGKLRRPPRQLRPSTPECSHDAALPTFLASPKPSRNSALGLAPFEKQARSFIWEADFKSGKILVTIFRSLLEVPGQAQNENINRVSLTNLKFLRLLNSWRSCRIHKKQW